VYYVIIENSIKVEHLNKDGRMKSFTSLTKSWRDDSSFVFWWYSAERYYFFFHNNTCHLWDSKTNCKSLLIHLEQKKRHLTNKWFPLQSANKHR